MSGSGPLAGATAFALSLALIPVIIRFCRRFDLLDQPGPLKIHTRATPRLGGLAIAIAIAVGILAGGVNPSGKWIVVSAFALLWAAGLIDDLRGLSPVLRLSIQILAALLLCRAGFGIFASHHSFSNVLVSCLFIVAIVNAFNFLDGSDGLATGVALIVSCAYILAPPANDVAWVLSWSLAGAAAAFLLFNFPPAKIFLGDSGSMTLGLSIACLGLNYYEPNAHHPNPLTPPSVFFPLVLTALPFLDAAFAIFRRLSNHASPFQGDRRHLYDLLLARGWSPRQVAFTWYSITLVFAVCGSLAMRFDSFLAIVAALAGVGAISAIAIRLGCLRSPSTHDRRPLTA